MNSAYSWQNNCSKALNAAVSCLADLALPRTLHCGCLGDTFSSIVASRHRNVLFTQSDKMASVCDVNVLHFGAKRVYNQSRCVQCPASRYTTQRETSRATTSSSWRWSDAGYFVSIFADVCHLFTIHTMWTVVFRCQVDTVSVTVMLWTEFPKFRHKYGQLSY